MVEKKLDPIWTWCPRCTVRTEHAPAGGGLRCGQCGCLHVGGKVIERSGAERQPAGSHGEESSHGL